MPSEIQHLHPKAVWLFFARCIWSIIFISVFCGLFFGPFLLSFVFTKKIVDYQVIEGTLIRREASLFQFFLKFLLSFSIILFVILIIISYIWARLSYRFWRYQLTEDAYKSERGIIFKRYVSIPYERIQNVDIYRGILDRLLGLSDLQIQTAGYGAAGGHGLRGFGSEGRLPGLSKEKAEEMREELIRRAKGGKSGV